MRFKCGTCGIECENIEELARHKKVHQSASNRPQGVICLGCGKGIPLEPSQMNYSGPLHCPSCGRTMTVVIEGGEVCFARLG